ncbi:MAG: winged helix-turn-helix transcriptional regulator [Phycisphaerae bacterium]|nr:winged helix-turn-helix transcriptional regulator [Phycisphaerae bacterium]
MMAVTRDKRIPAELLEQAADVLRVLAHPQRLRMLEVLAGQNVTVGDLAKAVGMAPAACSQHLNLMHAHGVLSRARDGRTTHYTVVNPHALALLECIRKHARPSPAAAGRRRDEGI